MFASKRLSPELELRIEAFTTLTPDPLVHAVWLKCDYIFLFGFSMKGQHREVPCGHLPGYWSSRCIHFGYHSGRTLTEGILDVHWLTLSLWISSTMESRDI